MLVALEVSDCPSPAGASDFAVTLPLHRSATACARSDSFTTLKRENIARVRHPQSPVSLLDQHCGSLCSAQRPLLPYPPTHRSIPSASSDPDSQKRGPHKSEGYSDITGGKGGSAGSASHSCQASHRPSAPGPALYCPVGQGMMHHRGRSRPWRSCALLSALAPGSLPVESPRRLMRRSAARRASRAGRSFDWADCRHLPVTSEPLVRFTAPACKRRAVSGRG